MRFIRTPGVTPKSPGFSLMKALLQWWLFVHGFPSLVSPAISPSAATCGSPEQPAEGVTECVWLWVKVISDPAAASGAWNNRGGARSSECAQPWCSTELFKSKWIKAILDSLWVFFLIIFTAAILLQCFLTQLIEVHRTKVPMRQEGFRVSCLLGNQLRPGCDRVSSFSQQGGVGRWESFTALCVCWTWLLLRFQGMDSSPAATRLGGVTFERDCSPKCENLGVPLPVPQALGLTLLYFKAFSSTSKALTPQSLIKEIKRNFTRLNQKQIYRIKECSIKNSGWKGESLKYSMYSK